MKRIILLFLAVCLSLSVFSQARLTRGKIDIPDLKGYVTLKCDFHIHTIFSDGRVWPRIRIDEAYREGLDAIAITDHIEGIRNRKDIPFITHNNSYDVAAAYAKDRGIILIKGGEITRSMPPGHSNAIFLTDVDELDKPEYMDAYRAAKAQNAFIFWNHPGWLDQQPDTTRWWPEHTKLLEQGMLHGIEIVNGEIYGQYYPEAHRWCLEKKLTMIGNTDAHIPMENFAPGKHRTMTLVFARSATSEAIHEALKERRTAVYFEEFVIGEEKYLKELFENSLEVEVKRTGRFPNNGEEVHVTVKNKSDFTFRLKKTKHDPRVIYFRNTSIIPYVIAPQSEQTFTVRLLEGITSGDVNFMVENFLVEPNKGMNYTIKVK